MGAGSMGALYTTDFFADPQSLNYTLPIAIGQVMILISVGYMLGTLAFDLGPKAPAGGAQARGAGARGMGAVSQHLHAESPRRPTRPPPCPYQRECGGRADERPHRAPAPASDSRR